MKYRDFIDFLQFKHQAENPTILDDDLPNAYEEWLDGLSPDEWIEYGEEYSQLVLHETYGTIN
jgi:hypothetical protein